jgi:hypothetical protein
MPVDAPCRRQNGAARRQAQATPVAAARRSGGLARNATRFSRLFGAKEGRAMVSIDAHGDPSEVVAEDGEVIVEGPDGIAVSLTPEAAEETGRRMLAAAAEARRQSEGSAP